FAIGQHRFGLYVVPRSLIELEKINVRCLERRWFWFGFSDAPKDYIVVKKIEHAEDPSRLTDDDDSVGGRTGSYRQPYRRPRGAPIALNVTINASKAWHGVVSFRDDYTYVHAVLPLEISSDDASGGATR